MLSTMPPVHADTQAQSIEQRALAQEIRRVLAEAGRGDLVAHLAVLALVEWRCKRCGRFLVEQAVVLGVLTKRCDRNHCQTINHLVDGVPQ